MSRAAFDALLDAARTAHSAHPELAAFCAFPDDLAATPVESHRIVAAALMESDEALRAAALHPLARAFLAASPVAKWRETYKDTAIGEDFMRRFGCYCLIGAGGAFRSAQMNAYVVYMPPALYYPWHHHPGEEMYYVLAGEAEFHREGEPAEVLGAGQSSQHASNQPHAMRTIGEPVLAYVIWRSHLKTPPVLTDRKVLQ